MHRILLLFVTAILMVACSKEPQTLAELEEAGKKAYLEEDYITARDYLGRAVTMKSSDRDVLYFLGMSYQREFLLDSALFYLKRADLLHPNDREVNSVMYPIAAQLGEWELAARAIMVMVVTGDSIEQYRERLADLNVKMGNIGVALIHAKELLRLEPDKVERYHQLAFLAHRRDSLDLAIEIIDQATEKFGEDNQLVFLRALVYMSQEDFASSEALLRRLVAADSTAINKLHLALALSKQDSNAKKLQAVDLFREVRDFVSPEYKVDSLLFDLELELNRESE
ncbi:MAG: hypothetical protein JSU74_05995 [Candidatus Zixiibacteriota bacterium]|nr:MAG: hypothetical protein JSU74_05995 [candidate division Zixibacteria bacterium]